MTEGGLLLWFLGFLGFLTFHSEDLRHYSIKLHLTPQQRKELEGRAEAEGRLVANCVSAIVVSRLRVP